MDSIGEYIWIIVIIISLLSSLFSNKKKKEQEARRREQEQNSVGSSAENRPASKLEDTLRDIFGEEEVTKTSSDSYSRSDGSESTWDPASDYEDYEEETKSTTNRILEQQKELEEKVARIRSNSASRSKKPALLDKIEVKSIESGLRDSYKKRRIVKLLKSPDSIKDLIIAQELLNKPKALRD
ncbi:MAG: hypothetical protein SCALA702_30550 [Melioribacteraceae bacterium]|nr:MAG: hypothetical protein SCALA702_30550 [Melioribacteraceae bacterium]